MGLRNGLFCGLLAIAACSSPQEEQLLEGPLEGAGIVFVSEQPSGFALDPPSADARALQEGAELVYRRGGDRIARLRVERDAELGFLRLIDTDTGLQTLHSLDLVEVGRDAPRQDGEEGAVNLPLLRLLPGDPWLLFPMWQGKEWVAEFASHAPGREPILLRVEYHCDAREMVTTPAGTFSCLRVWRAAGLAREGSELRRTSLYWYAPELGFVVRRLDDGQLLELEAILTAEEAAVERAAAGEAAATTEGEVGA